MKTRKILLTMFVLALVNPAQAQLNLNKLGKQVKKATEKKVEQTVSEKKSEVTQVVVEETVEASPVSGKDTDSSGVVSDEGMPDSYLGVPVGKNVFDHYAKLDDEIYYMWGDALSHYWYKSADESLLWLHTELWIFLNAIEASKNNIPMAFRDQGGRHLPVGEMGINAYFALFSARPDIAYPFFVRGRMFLKQIADGNISDDIKNVNVVIARVVEEDGETFSTYEPSRYMKYGYGLQDAHISDPFDKYKGDRVSRWKAEEARLMELYRKNIPYESVKATTINMLTQTAQATKDKHWLVAALNSYLLDVLINDLKEHPDKVEDDDYKFIVDTHAQWSANNYVQWREESQKNWREIYDDNQEFFKGAVTVPKAAISDPKLEAEMITIAKTIFDDGRVPVKAIIKNPDWDYDRTPLGQIIDRFQTAYIIYKMADGTHRMVDIGFKQMYNGGSYGKTQSRGIGLVNQVVEYNP